MSLKDLLSEVESSYKFSKPVTIKGIKYVLTVLDLDQERKANALIESLSNEQTMEYFNEVKKVMLSYAITGIKDTVLEDKIKDVDPEGKEVVRDRSIFVREFLGKLPNALVDKLFDAYIDAREEQEAMLNNDMKYDWFKTPEQREKEEKERREKEEAEAKAKTEAAEKKEPEEDGEIKFQKVNETNPDLPTQ